jgi:hypothetical protein
MRSIAGDCVISLGYIKFFYSKRNLIKTLTPIRYDSSRTLKRYINIYRIMGAHDDTPKKPKEHIEELKAIMLLLSIVVSHGTMAANLAREHFQQDRKLLAYFGGA